MGQPAIILILVALLVPLWWLLRRDYVAGLGYGVFLCVAMPTELRMVMPGSLPQLTIYRLVLISVFLIWWKRPAAGQEVWKAPMLGVFCFWALSNMVSVLLTTGDFVVSLKSYLDFVLEAAVFLLLLVTSLRTRTDALRILRSACLGVMLVATLAFVEKYTSVNPVNYLATAGDLDADTYTVRSGDIVATYQHRILFGTGMAMGWPLAMGLSTLSRGEGFRRRWLPWFATSLMLGDCYFSNSRGPWLAAVLAGLLVFMAGGHLLRRKLRLLLVLAFFVLALRPGIFDMLRQDLKATSDAASLKGGTFRYRLELWRIAWTQISSSPERFLFGCGPSCGMNSTLDWNLSYRGGQEWEVWSWDNHLAYDLYQSGILGLTASLLVYGGILLAAYRFWHALPVVERPLAACILASLVAYCFMLTNVLMFAKPVNFLFWTVAAILFVLARSRQSQEPDAGEVVTVGSVSEKLGTSLA